MKRIHCQRPFEKGATVRTRGPSVYDSMSESRGTQLRRIAGASARIENYLGLPIGITGAALMARAYGQAHKFGIETAIPAEVIGLKPSDAPGEAPVELTLSDDARVRARSVVIACGAGYRTLEVENLGAFEAASVHYWASPLETKLCAAQEVVLVGGGNSAGQAVVVLAAKCAKVWVLVRGPNLASSMSRYLVERIAGLANVEAVTEAEVTGLEGGSGILEAVRWRRRRSAEEVRRPIRHLPSSSGLTRRCRQRPIGNELPRSFRDRRRPIWLDRACRSSGRRHVRGSQAGTRSIGCHRPRCRRRARSCGHGDGASLPSPRCEAPR